MYANKFYNKTNHPTMRSEDKSLMNCALFNWHLSPPPSSTGSPPGLIPSVPWSFPSPISACSMGPLGAVECLLSFPLPMASWSCAWVVCFLQSTDEAPVLVLQCQPDKSQSCDVFIPWPFEGWIAWTALAIALLLVTRANVFVLVLFPSECQ